MTTLGVMLLVLLGAGAIVIGLGAFLAKRRMQSSKTPLVVCLMGALLCAGALAPLPYLASTSQLTILVADLGTNWPLAGQAENIFNDNGDIYTGEFKDGLYHGVGTLNYKDGSVYKGSFSEGLRNGQGNYTDTTGFTYTGGWTKDRMDGSGTYTYKDGSSYKGDFVKDIREGTGKVTFSSGAAYEGEWKDDEPNGQGVLTFSDKSRLTRRIACVEGSKMEEVDRAIKQALGLSPKEGADPQEIRTLCSRCEQDYESAGYRLLRIGGKGIVGWDNLW